MKLAQDMKCLCRANMELWQVGAKVDIAGTSEAEGRQEMTRQCDL